MTGIDCILRSPAAPMVRNLSASTLGRRPRKGILLARRIVIVGGGVAGMAAAASLADDHDVTLIEARSYLGGRAGSFPTEAGAWVDACQHVSLGCCSALHRLLRRANLDDQLLRQPTIWFHTLDGRISPFGPGWLPWPLDLAPSFARAHWLSLADKWAIARAVIRLKTEPLPTTDFPLKHWFEHSGQTRGAIEGLWGPVVVSALNEPWETASFLAAAKVFLEGMLGPPGSFQMELPRASLRELYDFALGGWLASQGISIRRDCRVTRLAIENDQVVGLQTRDGEFLKADRVILTLPRHQWGHLLDAAMLSRHPGLTQGLELGWAPITGIHLWLDRPLTDLPHAALVGTEGQWLFRHRQVPRFPQDSSHYHQVVISASGPSLKQGTDALRERIVRELAQMFPPMRKAAILDCKVVTEQRATIRPVPGHQAHRPGPASTVKGLSLAGDWTATGWPSTMEGAVRSGEEAARQIREEIHGG